MRKIFTDLPSVNPEVPSNFRPARQLARSKRERSFGVFALGLVVVTFNPKQWVHWPFFSSTMQTKALGQADYRVQPLRVRPEVNVFTTSETCLIRTVCCFKEDVPLSQAPLKV